VESPDGATCCDHGCYYSQLSYAVLVQSSPVLVEIFTDCSLSSKTTSLSTRAIE